MKGGARRREMVLEHTSLVDRLAFEAIRLGAEALVVEYKGGSEQVFAMKGGIGFGIASFRSSSPEAASLREKLRAIMQRKRRVTVDDCEYELRGHVYESFGEDVFRLELRRVKHRRGATLGRETHKA